MLGFAMVGASSGPPDSMTRTCAPDADNSEARTEPAAPAPTTMKSYCSVVILNLDLFSRGNPWGSPCFERARRAIAVFEKLYVSDLIALKARQQAEGRRNFPPGHVR